MADFMQKFWWKNLMHKVQSWGASVVLVGALFKITHWPGATVMLTVGLLVEAFIFFLSGVEPPHEEIDWTLVYPELKVSDELEDEILSSGSNKGTKGAQVAVPAMDSFAKFDEMLAKAGDDGLFEKLNTGLTKLSDNVLKMNDITDATVATTEFSDNVKKASNNVSQLSDTYKKSADELSNASQNITYSIDGLSDAFNKTQETVNSNKDSLTNAYQTLVASMDLDFSTLAEGNSEYNDKISGLNKNLTAINAIFEMQLGEANLEDMVKDVQESAVYAKKYSEEITKLSKNLGALNGVYGKMLSAMNVQAD
ncbi:MAG: gliding motility protein GldL [Bacteroidales bacterium]|nr:gliding motility protein GldL [Bacteroidales bacterium]